MAIVECGLAAAEVIREREQAEGYIAGICFKTGPPHRIGVELEWTVHRRDAPQAPVDTTTLRRALGPYAPTTLSPTIHAARPLPAGGRLSVEPGGQLEISSAPAASTAALHAAAAADVAVLAELLAADGMTLGRHGIDPHRAPHQSLHTPRYAAMRRVFDAHGPHGRTMMCSTAGLQVCLDAGAKHQWTARWAALSALGPVLLATFATSRRHAGADTGWASARMRTWYGIDARRTAPVDVGADPASAWARYALAAPLLCVRRADGCWDPPSGVTFADWIAGALPHPPTLDDLDYHLGTLFPPVRPRGYLEVRYLDAQPDDEWIAPTAVLAGLLADEATTDAARAMVEPVANRWLPAARLGLADRALRRAAADLVDLAGRRLDRTGLDVATRTRIGDILEHRLAPQPREVQR